MADLPTNYLDDILAQSMNGKRKFRITRPDGTFEEVIIEDISEYSQTGSTFGAGDINRANQLVNALNKDIEKIDKRFRFYEDTVLVSRVNGEGEMSIHSSQIKIYELDYLEGLKTNIQDFIDKVQCGYEVITTVDNGTATVNVHFNKPYNSLPCVVADVMTSLPNVHSVSVSDITKEGFKINLYRAAASANITVRWIAIAK